jgi:hypothetical protein
MACCGLRRGRQSCGESARVAGEGPTEERQALSSDIQLDSLPDAEQIAKFTRPELPHAFWCSTDRV